jgi:hypothetical protein
MEGIITVLSNDGSSILYSSYFGGSGYEFVSNIVVDEDGYYYITGFTLSSDLPTTTSAFDPTFNGGESSWLGAGMDGFVAKFDSEDHSRVYATYLGGSRNDMCFKLDVDSNGRAVVIGSSFSTNFPTTSNAYDTSYNGCDRKFLGTWWVYGGDFIVTQLAADGSTLRYSTYFGGDDYESGYGISLDSSGNAYIVGETYSSDLPTTNGAFDTSYNGGTDQRDGVIAKFNFSQSGINSLVYSTYIGGSGDEYTAGVEVDSEGYAYISSSTTSADFPLTLWAVDTVIEGGNSYEATVVKFDKTGSNILYSTYLGGSGWDVGNEIEIVSDSIYLAGYTTSSDFPVTSGAADTTFNGGLNLGDGFVLKMDLPDAVDMLDLLIEEIEDLVPEILNKGQGNSLISKLETAKKQIQKSNDATAINLLNAFIKEVFSMVKSGKLSSDVGAKLINAANFIISQIS